MMKLLTATLIVALLGGASGAGAQQIRFFRIASGAANGTYFPVAGLIAQAISAPPGSRACERGGACGVADMVAIAQSSEGSVNNAAAIQAGELESGLIQADIAYWAYSGTDLFQGKPAMRDLRVIANLFAEHAHVVVRRNVPAASLAELKGAAVALGPPGSGVLADARMLMEAAGLKETRDYEPLLIGPLRSAPELRAASIGAIVLMSGLPETLAADLLQDGVARLVPIDDATRGRVIKANGFFNKAVIPAGTYPGQAEPVDTVSIAALWVTSASQPEGLIHDIVKALWNKSSRKLFDAGHPQARALRADEAVESLPIPLHPGAERYYREAGLLQ